MQAHRVPARPPCAPAFGNIHVLYGVTTLQTHAVALKGPIACAARASSKGNCTGISTRLRGNIVDIPKEPPLPPQTLAGLRRGQTLFAVNLYGYQASRGIGLLRNNFQATPIRARPRTAAKGLNPVAARVLRRRQKDFRGRAYARVGAVA
jgi:hypothetical protein